MRNSYPLILFLSLFFLFQACGDSGSISQPQGTHVSDTLARPERGNTSGKRPWSVSENLLDPNGFDQIESPISGLGLPINAAFAKNQKLKTLEIRSYSETDNNDLQDGSTEASLSVSRKQSTKLDANGMLAEYLDEKFLGVGDPITSKKAIWTWDNDQRSGLVEFEEKVGNKVSKHNFVFGLDADGRLFEANDASLLTVFHWEDVAKGHRYIAYKSPKSKAKLFVVGKMDAWADLESVVDLDDDLRKGFSEIVDYAKLGGKPERIVFLEWDGRKTLQEFEIDHKGFRTKEVKRIYDEVGNIVERSSYWDDANANLRTKMRYKYADNGDLIETIYQRQRFNDDMINEIDRYVYDANGLLEKHIQTSRKNQGTEEVLLLEFYTWTKETASSPAPLEAQPGGTR